EGNAVVAALLVCLDVAVEHRAVRRDSELVRGVVDVEPDVRVLLPGRDQPAHALPQPLRPAPTRAPPPAPPPRPAGGREPSPASRSSRRTSSCVSPERVVMWWISEAV